MKRFLIILCIVFASTGICRALEDVQTPVTFTKDERWGLKDKTTDTIIADAVYKKLIPVGDSTWIVQNKKNKYGLIDNNGNVLVPLKYNHADRIVSKFSKFGNHNDYGLYDEFGKNLVPHKYAKIDILYGGMFLTYKNYKYGITGYNGEIILENEFDDIYMPKPNTMVISYNGNQYELEKVNAQTLLLPADAKNELKTQEDLNFHNLVVKTSAASGYSVLTFSDYLIKMISSISPAHEETIDELMLSQGADTMNILIKMTWVPKYPFVYARKYYQNVRNPNNGPLSGVRHGLKKHMK
ncbi:MAG: WG repeat-containing protein [Muribaculaceae bacterium]|nr:WG repeat-containing protein [Muribaculaceae bacterium]